MFADKPLQPPKARFFIGYGLTREFVLLAYGRLIQAIVKSFPLDERMVRARQQRAVQHGQQAHEHLIENSQHDLEQLQAAKIKAKTKFGTLWMGGVVSPKRDLDLIKSLPDKVRQMALCRPPLLAVDGLASYVSAFRNAFQSKFPRREGETERCKMVSWQGIAIVQVVKQRVEGVLYILWVVSITSVIFIIVCV